MPAGEKLSSPELSENCLMRVRNRVKDGRERLGIDQVGGHSGSEPGHAESRPLFWCLSLAARQR